MEHVFASDFRKELKKYMDEATDHPIVIERRRESNLVIMSENEYSKILEEKIQRDIICDIEDRIDELIKKRLQVYTQKIIEQK